MNGTEHINWCKRRALKYLNDNHETRETRIRKAINSMVSDLKKHDDTEKMQFIMPSEVVRIMSLTTAIETINAEYELRKKITDFASVIFGEYVEPDEKLSSKQIHDHFKTLESTSPLPSLQQESTMTTLEVKLDDCPLCGATPDLQINIIGYVNVRIVCECGLHLESLEIGSIDVLERAKRLTKRWNTRSSK